VKEWVIEDPPLGSGLSSIAYGKATLSSIRSIPSIGGPNEFIKLKSLGDELPGVFLS